jgi:hypothetical protein
MVSIRRKINDGCIPLTRTREPSAHEVVNHINETSREAVELQSIERWKGVPIAASAHVAAMRRHYAAQETATIPDGSGMRGSGAICAARNGCECGGSWWSQAGSNR